MPEYNKYLGMLENGAIQGVLTGINNYLSRQQSDYDRQENYRLNELAAASADQRTRALYNDFYSPSALMKQYKIAGLSPSLLFGGTPGQGGATGGQGGGPAGPQSAYMPLSIIEAAQVANIQAQTQKTKEETKNIAEDTNLKLLQEEWNTMLNKEKSIEFKLTTTYVINTDGTTTSMFELAQNCYDYDKFIEEARRLIKNSNDKQAELMLGTEAGQRTMRQIYMDSNRYERDIKILSQEGVNAEFQQAIIKKMEQKGFAEQNANTAIAELKSIEETAKLTTEQKEAWNNIIERLQKTNSTTADIIIVASMILNQAASKWHNPIK